MSRRVLTILVAAVTGLCAMLLAGPPAHAAPVTVVSGTQFTDTSGALVHAHGGGVLQVGDYYYLFGENRHDDNTFRAFSVYRSTDLRDWEFRNDVLTQASDPELELSNIERPKVVYNDSTGQFVMWMHKENGTDYTEARAAVAVSDTVDGDYEWRGSFRPPSGTTSRDQTVFVDDDGTAYQATSTEGNADLHIYRLTDDYLGYDTLVANPWSGTFREAPALFRRDGVYFMLTSANSGWEPNQQRYATAPSIEGPWTPMADVGDATGYGSQTTFVLPVHGTEGTSYLYLGDRWGNSFGGTVNDSRYVWLPLGFPTRTTLNLPWYPETVIDTEAGTVTGSGGGPYHTLVAGHSGRCVDVADNSSAEDASVVQYACNGGLNQRWRLADAGEGRVRIMAQHSGKCLDVADGSSADGQRVIQYSCGTGDNQLWRVEDRPDGLKRLVAQHSGKCLSVSDGSAENGAELVQQTCGNDGAQGFELRAME
ncbi:RICIN domain-containing protein [Streptomyces sp. NBRC 109706]|uniref:RICIN domain-containing protein n=1 Tax=Streptomyces sp. NBRC 109706 TaxID=1550035 RepID=UPI000AF1957A|nr:RICIN domain-containing protein [Streptomyces sp. NBRC 109706]